MKRIIYIMVLLASNLIFSCTEEKVKTNDDNNESIQIYLNEFDTYFRPDSCQMDVDLDLIGDRGTLSIQLLNCKGMIKFQQLDSGGNLILSGGYSSSQDTLKKYSIGKSIINDSKEIKVMKYFQPIPDGVWVFYKNGSIEKKIKYALGLIEEGQ